MHLVFVVETTENNDSDKMYISKYISICCPQLKESPDNLLSWVYLNGKGNYRKGSVLKKVNDLIARYNRFHPNENDTYVLYCVDIDDTNQTASAEENKQINKEIEAFCRKEGYELVWFNRTIEEVFLGRTVKQAKDKKREANAFMKKKTSIDDFPPERLKKSFYSESVRKSTNLGFVLDVLVNQNKKQ